MRESKACAAITHAAGAPMAMTAEYGSSAAPVARVTAVVVSAIPVASGSDPVKRCQTGTRTQPAIASDISAHG